MKHEGWEEAVLTLRLQLDPAQAARLDAYHELLLERAVPLGFVAAGDVGRLRERHIVDSLRAAPLVHETDRSAYDLGSGAGLPGIPIAIACPGLSMGLIESRRPRAAFLELAVEELALPNVYVIHERVEEVSELVDVCLARAFAAASASWEAAERLLVPAGRLIYFGGQGFDPGSLPGGLRTEVVTNAALASTGPLVIMAQT